MLGGCVSNATQDTLKAKGSSARLMNSLLFPVFWIAVVVFVLVGGLVCVAVFRFRARSDDEAPKQVHGNTRMEIGWTIAPALLLACIAVPTVKFVFDVSAIPRNAMTVVVTGHRWWWQADYMSQTDPNQTLFTTATELHIPVKTNVVISLTSVDVIHNFWVPELAGKLYAIPGRHNKLVIEADKPGTYYGQCAEYCGTSHANMRLRVIAQNQDDYNAWQAHEQEGPVTPVVAAAPASSSAGGAAGVDRGHRDRVDGDWVGRECGRRQRINRLDQCRGTLDRLGRFGRHRRPAVHVGRLRRLPRHRRHLLRRGRPQPDPLQQPERLRGRNFRQLRQQPPIVAGQSAA